MGEALRLGRETRTATYAFGMARVNDTDAAGRTRMPMSGQTAGDHSDNA